MLSAVVGILASVEEQLNNVQEELGVDASAAQIHACIDSTVDRLRTEANPVSEQMYCCYVSNIAGCQLQGNPKPT